MIKMPQQNELGASWTDSTKFYRIWGIKGRASSRMDPLTIITSTLTLLGSVAAVAKGMDMLQTVRKAPTQISMVLNEVTDLRLVIKIVESTIRNGPRDTQHEIIQGICQLASRANKILLELTAIFNRVFRADSTAEGVKVPVLSRRVWIRERSTIEMHCRNLRETRNNLTAALTALSSSHMGVQPSTHLVLQTSITQMEESISTWLEQLSQNIIDSKESKKQDVEPQKEGYRAKSVVGMTKRGEQAPALFSVEAVDLIEKCEDFCPCNCHLRKTGATPSWLRGVIGSVFYSYTGSPIFGRRPCNYLPCKRAGKREHQYTYHFPTWMLARSVSMYFTRTHLAGVGGSWTLSIPKALSDVHPIWRFINYGTVPQVAEMLPKYGIAPCDVNKDGKSLLHFSVEWGRPDMCAFLLHHSTNQFFEDRSGFSAAMMAWELVLPPDATAKRQTELTSIQNLFKSEDVYDTMEFSPLHLAVINMDDRDFEKQLKLNISSMDFQDALGRTPLIWACASKSLTKACKLLKAGAALDRSDKHGKTALHWAVVAKAIDLVSILLDYGAPLEARDIFGRTPMFEGSRTPNSHSTIRLLVERGAEVDARDYGYYRTPLQLASYHGQAENARSLLSLGANIENITSTKRRPLLDAIAYNQLSTVKVLIEEGARADVFDGLDQGILHLAAQFACAKIMRALLGANVLGIDAEKKDSQDRTAEYYFKCI
ncbi:ankyrin [Annulohypoxylon bovei var. microspora]|nr:ankyrin [Annulohypoxylon bovei var. microspora]